MSYQEVRNFIELMRELGFQRKISLENFRTPNFLLVAEILFWMVQKYDPTAQIADSIEDEKDRVNFINCVTQLFAVKARLKLIPKRLYEANGAAVKEMLKVASMLSKAVNYSANDEESISSDFNLSSKLFDLKQARQMAKDITEIGAKLFDMMDKEVDLQVSRNNALEFLDSLSKNLDSNKEQEYIEKCIMDIISTQKESVSQMEKMYENLKQDEENLELKIKRKSDELERAEKRLKSIQNVRPAFMDEYEQLEKELEKLYGIYVERYRNLDYLEHELDIFNDKEQKKRIAAEDALVKMRAKIKIDELKVLKGEKPVDEEEVDEQMKKGLDEMAATKTGFNKKKLQQEVAQDQPADQDGDDGQQDPDDDKDNIDRDDDVEGDDGQPVDEEELARRQAELEMQGEGEGEPRPDENTDSEVMQEDEPDNDF